MIYRPHRLKKTSSMQSKVSRSTSSVTTSSDNYCYLPRWITTTFFPKLRTSCVLYWLCKSLLFLTIHFDIEPPFASLKMWHFHTENVAVPFLTTRFWRRKSRMRWRKYFGAVGCGTEHGRFLPCPTHILVRVMHLLVFIHVSRSYF